MGSTDDDYEDTGGRAPWTLRVKQTYWPPPAPKPGEDGEPDRIPPEQRRDVMRSLDPREVRLAFVAFVLATVAGIAIPAYIIATNKVTKHGKNTYAVAPGRLAARCGHPCPEHSGFRGAVEAASGHRWSSSSSSSASPSASSIG